MEEGEVYLSGLPSFDFDFEETTNGALPSKKIGDRHPYQSSDGGSHAWNEEEEEGLDREEEGEREGCRKRRREKLDYRNKVLLAPMVRVGLLPFRLLCLSYGADIVYSEEIVDKKLELCKRRLNPELGTVEFFPKGKDPSLRENLVFQTCSEDTPTVLQLGTATSVGALKATEIVIGDIDAVDVNMGCPVHFSIQGGMGSALLSKPDTIHDILTTLVRNVPECKAVTCKIRLLENREKTVDLLRMIEKTGVTAVAVHSRYIADRPRFPARWEELTETLKAAALSIPVIANGDVFIPQDVSRIREVTEGLCTSVMIARGALDNPSVFLGASDSLHSGATTISFGEEGKDEVVRKGKAMLSMETVFRDYLEMCVRCEISFQHPKYVLQQFLKHELNTPRGILLNHAKSLSQLWNAVVATPSSFPSYIYPSVLSFPPFASSSSSFSSSYYP